MSLKRILFVMVCLVLVLSSDAAGKLKKRTNVWKKLDDRKHETSLRLDAMDLDQSALFCADSTSSKMETVFAFGTCVTTNVMQIASIGVAGFFKNTGRCLETVFDTFMACLTENVRNELKTIARLVFKVASTQTEDMKASISAFECSAARINDYMVCVKTSSKTDFTVASSTIYTEEFCRKQTEEPCNAVIPKYCQDDPQMAKLNEAVADMLTHNVQEHCKRYLSNSASKYHISVFTAFSIVVILLLLF